MHVNRTTGDEGWLDDALVGEAICEVEAYGTALKIPAAVDATIDRHNLRPDESDQLRESLIRCVTDLVEFPCRADLGPTMQCRFMECHEVEGVPHDSVHWESDPLTQELAEDMYLLAADPEAGP
jgi:hypothetical protein